MDSGDDDNKPGFYIQAAVHSREWLANAATMYILNALAEGYGHVDRITNILDAINIYIAPTVNIDGYIYSWEVNRMWRKNRRDNGDGTFGIDLNRNYDGPVGTWCSTGASTNPNSDTYCGSAAFSEPETYATALFMKNDSLNIRAAFDMHTSGQLIMYPWAYTKDKVESPYYEEFARLGEEQEDAIYNVHGVQYRPIQIADFCVCSGSSVDFAWSEGILGFGYEGRGPGFNPPPENIILQGQEQLAAVLVVAESLID